MFSPLTHSSSTKKRTADRSSFPVEMRSSSRPGVATTISTCNIINIQGNVLNMACDRSLNMPIKYSGTANGRVLNKELYTQTIQTLVFLHLFTELFCKDVSSLIKNCNYFTPRTHLYRFVSYDLGTIRFEYGVIAIYADEGEKFL